MNTECSYGFSEKLKKVTNVKKQLDSDTCIFLTDPTTEFINTFEVIQKILEHCAWSVMYVEYGVYYFVGSFAPVFLLQVYAIPFDHRRDNNDKNTGSFDRFIDDLLDNYRLLIDKLAVVSANLRIPIQLIA